MRKKFNLSKGFTLIELLVVISIIGVLLTVGVFGYRRSVLSSRDAKRKADLVKVQSALENYRSNNISSDYPQVLSALVPDYIASLPTDPVTGLPYSYTAQCTPSGTNPLCRGYILEATLESTSQTYGLNQNSEVLVNGAIIPTFYIVSTTPLPPTPTKSPTPTPLNPPTPTRTPTPPSCVPIGGQCDKDDMCCEKYCNPISKLCANPPSCAPDKSACTTNLDCCSTYCNPSNKCAPVPACLPNTSICTKDDDCCSKYCTPGMNRRCAALPTPACFPNSHSCSFPSDCCSNYCRPLLFICEVMPTNTPTPPACIVNGQNCSLNSQCCSNYCHPGTGRCSTFVTNTPIPPTATPTNTPIPPTPTRTATPVPPTPTPTRTPTPTNTPIPPTPTPPSCLPDGISCSSNAQCCSGYCNPTIEDRCSAPPTCSVPFCTSIFDCNGCPGTVCDTVNTHRCIFSGGGT